MGCTFPALSHGFFMSPFNSRELVEQCMRVPEGYRRKSAAVFDCIHRFNPALADVPTDFEFVGASPLGCYWILPKCGTSRGHVRRPRTVDITNCEGPRALTGSIWNKAQGSFHKWKKRRENCRSYDGLSRSLVLVPVDQTLWRALRKR